MRMPSTSTLALVALVACGAASAQYKYTTPDGRTVYSDQPPPANARTVQQRDFGGTAGSDVDTASLPYELRRTVQSFPVTLYTSTQCPACDTARTVLRARGVPFSERTVTTDADIAAFRARGFGKGVPVITVGNTRLEGYEEGALQSALTVAGYPTQSLLPRSYANPPAAALAPVAPPAGTQADAPPAPPSAPASSDGTPAPPGFRF